MTKFTKEQMNQIKTQVEMMMDQLAEGKNAREICAQMYVNGLNEKTLSQGEAMADSIMESILDFDRDFNRAKTDVDAFVDEFVNDVCQDKALDERCTYLMKLIAAISSAKTMLDADTDEKREQAQHMITAAENTQVFEDEATEELESRLRMQLKNALRGSDIMISALEAQRKSLTEIENEDEAAALLMDAGNRTIDYRAILSMQAYINIKNGVYEDIPSNVSAAQVATMVCVYEEEIHILQQLETHEIAEEVAHALLGVLGIVAILRMSFTAAGIGVAICSVMFGWILTIPAVLVLITSLANVSCRMMDEWCDASGKIAHYATVGVKAICHAAERVLSFAAIHTKHAFIWLFDKAKNAVNRLMEMLRVKHDDPETTITAEDLENAVDEDELLEEEADIAEECDIR